ncbi:MAG: lytic transglycosylase domain-containing protein [Pseudomonadota bacterium]
MRKVSLSLKCATIFLAAVMSQNLTAEKTYVYKDTDGTIWYTNIVPEHQDTGRFQLLAVKGRSTATSSCKGMTPSRLRGRASTFESTIQRISGEFKVDSKLVKAVIRNESCFDINAISSAGAQGLMQLMPPTAAELGVINPFDAEENIRGGTQYLSSLLQQYDNNIGLALAAYNAGPGNVARYNGVPPFKETRRYVEKVMDTYRNYLREHLHAAN